MLKRSAFFVLVLLAGAAGARAAGGQAYSAVRTAQQVASSGSLVSLSGDRGEPQPSAWTLIFSDPQARGGVREVEVANGEVISQRTPLRGYTDATAQPPIQITRLKVDSDEAFQIANRQAKAKHIGFHWIDYSMRANNVDGTPLWILRLYDYMGAQVGIIEISAENGTIVMPLQVASTRSDETTTRFEETGTGQRVGGVIGTVTGAVEKAGTTAKDATLRAVGTVQEVLTGERTIGPKDDN
jgi:hypothetical protein